MSDPQIFVDDSDPNITYSGDWKVLHGLTNAHFSGTSAAINPLYGTVHASSGNGTSTLSYSFNGTGVRAIFHTKWQDSFTCTIDGSDTVLISPTDSGVECNSTSGSLQAGTHNIVISAVNTSVSLPFDGIYYTPSSTPTADVDVSFNGNNSVIQKSYQNPRYMQAIGDKVEIDFVGHSLSVYGDFFDGNIPNSLFPHNSALSLMSYTLDDGPPINFTISNPTNSANPEITSQLIVQTPRLPSAGAHRFIMTLTGAAGTDNVVITVSSIIIQNATLPVVPDAIPPVPSSQAPASSSSSSSALSIPTNFNSSSSGRSTKKNSIIIPSVLVPVLVVLTIFAFLICRRRRRQPLNEDDSLHVDAMAEVEPFQAPEPSSGGYGTSNSKLSPLRRPDSAAYQDSGYNQRPQRYRYHSDGGALLNADEYAMDDETVDVPPLYGSFKNNPIRGQNHVLSYGANSSSTGPSVT